MKVTKQDKTEEIMVKYSNFPKEGTSIGRITEWDNGEGFDVNLGGTYIELSNNEITALEILFANTRLLK